MRRATFDVRLCLHPLAYALYPLSVVVAANAGVVPVSAVAIVRTAAASLAAGMIVLFAARGISADQARQGAIATCFLLLSGLYAPIVIGFGRFGVYWKHTDWLVSVPYVGLAAWLAVAATWPGRAIDARYRVIGLAGFLLVGFNVASAAWAMALPAGAPWRPSVESMRERAVYGPGAASRPDSGNVYYLVLDGFGRADVLRDRYQLDLAPFVHFLESRGFSVPAGSRSNYAQTFLSLASALNLSYLDDLARAMGPESRDRRPLHELVRRNALMEHARRAGFRVVAIGSDYSATERFEQVDVCHCRTLGLPELDHAVIGLTPLAALPLDPWTHGAHRRKVRSAFSEIEQVGREEGPSFVFAHVVAPHPPFVFGADGSARTPDRLFTFRDGDHFPGHREEYIEGYRQQTRFIVSRLAGLVEVLLARPGPLPTILIQADHGPGSALHWSDPASSDLTERMGIFSAYYFPDGGGPGLGPSTSPINGARWLANVSFGLDLPMLPDESYFSTWDRPYDLIRVP